jgi:hypothetical protein
MRVQGSGVQGSGFRVQGSGGVQGSGFRVQGGSGFRVQGSGVQGFRVLRVQSKCGRIISSVASIPESSAAFFQLTGRRAKYISKKP